MTGMDALAAVNGGYFDPEDAPVGLLVSEGRRLAPLRKAKLLSGVLFATRNRVDVVRATRFSMSDKIKSALQCGPLLVERSGPVAGFDVPPSTANLRGGGRQRPRRAGSLFCGFARRVGPDSLPDEYGRKEVKIARALNLDGGSSSAFGFRQEWNTSIAEQKAVRDFVAIVPR